MGWEARKGKDFTFVYCQVLLCEQKIKTHRQKEKKTFANMFDKFAAIDQKRSVHHILHLWINQLVLDEWIVMNPIPLSSKKFFDRLIHLLIHKLKKIVELLKKNSCICKKYFWGKAGSPWSCNAV